MTYEDYKGYNHFTNSLSHSWSLVNNLTQNKGFLLTRQSFDRAGKSEIHYWLSTPLGPAKLVVSGVLSILFIKQDDLQQTQNALQSLGIEYTYKLLELNTFTEHSVAA